MVRAPVATSWEAEIGYAGADYQDSGTDHSLVSKLRGNWQATPKVSAYVFGGNNYQPGYGGGGARMVYRLGYGARWNVVPKFTLLSSIFHDYQEQVASSRKTDSDYDDTVKTFFDLKAEYEPIDPLSLVAGLRYNHDQYDDDQTIISLKAVYRFY